MTALATASATRMSPCRSVTPARAGRPAPRSATARMRKAIDLRMEKFFLSSGYGLSTQGDRGWIEDQHVGAGQAARAHPTDVHVPAAWREPVPLVGRGGFRLEGFLGRDHISELLRELVQPLGSRKGHEEVKLLEVVQRGRAVQVHVLLDDDRAAVHVPDDRERERRVGFVTHRHLLGGRRRFGVGEMERRTLIVLGGRHEELVGSGIVKSGPAERRLVLHRDLELALAIETLTAPVGRRIEHPPGRQKEVRGNTFGHGHHVHEHDLPGVLGELIRESEADVIRHVGASREGGYWSPPDALFPVDGGSNERPSVSPERYQITSTSGVSAGGRYAMGSRSTSAGRYSPSREGSRIWKRKTFGTSCSSAAEPAATLCRRKGRPSQYQVTRRLWRSPLITRAGPPL